MFDGYLSDDEIQEIRAAMVSSGAVNMERGPFFRHVFPGFFAILKKSNTPLEQFELDIDRLNGVQRLENGSVPLHQYLTNIGRLLRAAGQAEAAVFERYASVVGQRAQGVVTKVNVAALPEIVRNEKIIHQDDTVAFGFLAKAIAVGKSVARIRVPRFENGQQIRVATGGPYLTSGTGWLIGTDLFITNHHVINSRDAREAPARDADFAAQAAGSTAMFDFDADGSATETASVSKLEFANRDLDYAVLRLSAMPSGRPPLALNTQPITMSPSTYLPVNIIQHPQGLPKRIAFRNNLLSGADNDTIRYFTDTDFGSSGAPVCDDSWQVVALHRGAEQVRNVNFQGRDTAFVNFGTQVTRLLDDLKQRRPEVYEEIVALATR